MLHLPIYLVHVISFKLTAAATAAVTVAMTTHKAHHIHKNKHGKSAYDHNMYFTCTTRLVQSNIVRRPSMATKKSTHLLVRFTTTLAIRAKTSKNNTLWMCRAAHLHHQEWVPVGFLFHVWFSRVLFFLRCFNDSSTSFSPFSYFSLCARCIRIRYYLSVASERVSCNTQKCFCFGRSVLFLFFQFVIYFCCCCSM